ncbi:MAG: hypothetical protein IPM79_20170 [Polyangiaceae bacterium]|jgi:hypothetical protein|nr:hypothetical protein [Polyangiaceae bacterium]
MAFVPYYYVLRHMPGLALRLALNDVPFYRGVVTFNKATNGPVNHALVPGLNTVRMDLAAAPVNPDSPSARVVLDFDVLEQEGDRLVHTVRYPQLLERHEPKQRKLPLTHVETFEVEGDVPPPIWENSPREEFPESGTSEQLDCVFELWDAYKRQDIGAFLSATEVKLSDHQRYYGAAPELAPAEAARTYGAKLREPWDVAPFEPHELSFERWADGRVAYVTRKDGGFALLATHKTDPGQRWRANLYLTKVDGRWRIFR